MLHKIVWLPLGVAKSRKWFRICSALFMEFWKDLGILGNFSNLSCNITGTFVCQVEIAESRKYQYVWLKIYIFLPGKTIKTNTSLLEKKVEMAVEVF